jgi:uncharacterized protein
MHGGGQTSIEEQPGELRADHTGESRDDRFVPSERSRVRRLPKRASYDRATVYAILDAALVAHVAFVHDGEPFVIPMAFARMGDAIVLHGSKKARILETIVGARVSLTVTLVDGLVLARSAFHHSMNYRSATVFGRPRLLESDGDRLRALEVFTDRLLPGRWATVRPPNAQELLATAVVELPIEEASSKTRSGGPIDDPEDLTLPVWAGVLPLDLLPGAPRPEPESHGVALPEPLERRVHMMQPASATSS